jgi:hypothetical protein
MIIMPSTYFIACNLIVDNCMRTASVYEFHMFTRNMYKWCTSQRIHVHMLYTFINIVHILVYVWKYLHIIFQY